jgi:hypothetical protein
MDWGASGRRCCRARTSRTLRGDVLESTEERRQSALRGEPYQGRQRLRPGRDPYLLGMGARVGSDEAFLARWPQPAAPVVFCYGRRGRHDMSRVRRGGHLLGHFDITSRTPTYRANTNSQRNRWEGRDSCRPHCKTRNVLDLGSSLCTQHQNQQDR